MKRPRWRRVRKGHEREDMEVLSDPSADDFCIAANLVGWRLVPLSGRDDCWPLNGHPGLIPS